MSKEQNLDKLIELTAKMDEYNQRMQAMEKLLMQLVPSKPRRNQLKISVKRIRPLKRGSNAHFAFQTLRAFDAKMSASEIARLFQARGRPVTRELIASSLNHFAKQGVYFNAHGDNVFSARKDDERFLEAGLAVSVASNAELYAA